MKEFELISRIYGVEVADEEAAVFEGFGRGYEFNDWVRSKIGGIIKVDLAFHLPEQPKFLRFRIDAEVDAPELHQEIKKLLQDFLDLDRVAIAGTRRDALPPLVRATVDEAKITDKDILTILVNFGMTNADKKWRQRLHDFVRHVLGSRILGQFDGISEGLWNEMREAGWSAADAIAPVMELVRSNEHFYISDAEKHIRQAIIASRSQSTPHV